MKDYYNRIKDLERRIDDLEESFDTVLGVLERLDEELELLGKK